MANDESAYFFSIVVLLLIILSLIYLVINTYSEIDLVCEKQVGNGSHFIEANNGNIVCSPANKLTYEENGIVIREVKQ